MSNALAVHDEDFQLDGDVSESTTTNVGGNTQAFDWDSIFGGTEIPDPLPADGKPDDPAVTLPANFGAAGFHTDFLLKSQRGQVVFDSKDNSTYTTGSKDTLPISGWQCARSNNVGGKVDIMNAYAAIYTDPSTGDEILYFGQERNANDGDANVGFWFLQDETVACESSGKALTFSGEHEDGDLFIVSAFTSGGAVSGITAYEWDDTTGGLIPIQLPPGSTTGDCRNLAAGDSACATVNTSTLSPDTTPEPTGTPWLTANKDDGVGHTLRTAEFFEGGLNLNDAGLAGTCFSRFLSNTRSSQSLTATIFDFAVGQLSHCGISTTQSWVPNDTATVTGGAVGNVDFTLYVGTGDCDASAADSVIGPGDPSADPPVPPDLDFFNRSIVGGVAKTNNTTEFVAGTEGETVISWSATLDTADVDVTSKCEASTLNIDNDTSSP